MKQGDHEDPARVSCPVCKARKNRPCKQGEHTLAMGAFHVGRIVKRREEVRQEDHDWKMALRGGPGGYGDEGPTGDGWD